MRRLSGRHLERPSDAPQDDLPGLIAALLSAEPTDRATRLGLLRRLSLALAASARRAGAVAVGSGRWMNDSIVEMAPHVPVRDAVTLSEHYGGLRGDALASALVDDGGPSHRSSRRRRRRGRLPRAGRPRHCC